MMIAHKLMTAAVAVVVILAFWRISSSLAAYKTVTTIIRYIITPNTAPITQAIYKSISDYLKILVKFEN